MKKKNVFFRALPESPTPPNNLNLKLFFRLLIYLPPLPTFDFQILNFDVRKKGRCPNWGQGGGFRGFGQYPKENVLFHWCLPLPVLSVHKNKRKYQSVQWWIGVPIKTPGKLVLWSDGVLKKCDCWIFEFICTSLQDHPLCIDQTDTELNSKREGEILLPASNTTTHQGLISGG